MITPSRDKDRTLRHLCQNLASSLLLITNVFKKRRKFLCSSTRRNDPIFLSTKSYNRLTQRLNVRTLDRLTAMGQENSRLETIARKT